MTRRPKCPPDCHCHDTGSGVSAEHGTNGHCPTKDGLPLIDPQWKVILG